MADIDAAFVEQIFDLPQRKRKPDIHHHRQADDLGGRLEISEWISHRRMLRNAPHRLKPVSPDTARHAALSPYLFDAGGLSDPHLVVREESAPINGTGRLITGTQPLEDGNLTFSSEEKASFLEHEPSAGPYFRPFPGAASSFVVMCDGFSTQRNFLPRNCAACLWLLRG